MTVEGWAQAVRQQLAPGRLLPLGGRADGAWITERAASGVLRDAAAGVEGVRPGRLRLALADAGQAGAPAVPPPPSALPPGPLRVEADFEATAREPLPETAGRLREALFAAADHSLGLDMASVDLRVTGLIDAPTAAPPGAEGAREAEAQHTGAAGPDAGVDAGAGAPEPRGPGEEAPRPGEAPAPGEEASARIAAAAAAVPGVLRLAPVLGDLRHAVRIHDRDDPPRRHVLVQLALATTHRALDVTGAVRAAVTAAAAADTSAPVTVAALVTAVETP